MKRVDGLYEQIVNEENIDIADANARKHKKNKYGILLHDQNKEEENRQLLESLRNLSYKTSDYTTYKIYEPKERTIFRLPYSPDRIAHHAIMNVMEKIWVSVMIPNTYSCIKGRGIMKLATDLKKNLKEDSEGTKYCLKIDIKKFYPSIKHHVLKRIIRKKIKDKRVLFILDEIIDSSPGVPIGNYLSLFFANLTLAYYDHWVKEELKVKYYYRYADDIVFLSDSKDFLHNVLVATKLYLTQELELEIKPNYSIFPVSKGIDFVGYKFYHDHTVLRKSLKNNIKKLVRKYKSGKITKEELEVSMLSYYGWLKYCDSKHFLLWIEKETGLHYSNFRGEETIISNFSGQCVRVIDVVYHKKYITINFYHKGKPYSIKSLSKRLRGYFLNLKLPINIILNGKRKKNKVRK